MRLELTRRGDYGVRAMLALSRWEGPGPLSARRIAEGMGIPLRFVPQVMADLARAGLVESTPGRTGGYRIARAPEAVSLLDVIEAIEGDSRRRTCVLRGGPCGRDGYCDVHDPFFAGQDALLSTLATTTFASLPERLGGWIAADEHRPGDEGDRDPQR